MGVSERISELADRVEERKFHLPETVGTARVKNVFSFEHSDRDSLELDIQIRGPIIDDSQYIHAVPRGWFEKGDIVEVIAKRYKGTFISNIPPELKIHCRVAVRPFLPLMYGRGVDTNSQIFNSMFEESLKRPKSSEGFYRRFLPDDFREFVEEEERFLGRA